MAWLILGQNSIWGEILKTSDAGVRLFDSILQKYKVVRRDITAAQAVQTGNGCLMLFANTKGTCQYVTVHATASTFWHTEGFTVRQDSKGRAVVTATFTEPSAKIILFCTQ